MKEKQKRSVAELCVKYSSDNKEILSVIGVFSTVTALFLNLNNNEYGALGGIQILLLLALILSFIALAHITIIWFKENHDSHLGGLFSFSIGLFIYRLIVFVVENFREDLNDYLVMISIILSVIVVGYLLKAQEYFESKFPKHTLRFILFGVSAFVYFYIYHVFSSLYINFSHGQPLETSFLAEPFRNTLYLSMSAWVIVSSYVREKFNRGLTNWLTIVTLWIPIAVFAAYLIFMLILIIKY